MEILANNLLVFLIYVGAGRLTKIITGSKLAPLVPWAIFSVHSCVLAAKICAFISESGFLACLAVTAPHGCLEIPGLIIGCNAGGRLCQNSLQPPLLLTGIAFISAAAWLETCLPLLGFPR